jgi:hypothetical protein
MNVVGPLTHARFTAEASRIVRKASRWIAHETLRMHTGDHKPKDLVSDEDRNLFVKEITEILEAMK